MQIICFTYIAFQTRLFSIDKNKLAPLCILHLSQALYMRLQIQPVHDDTTSTWLGGVPNEMETQKQMYKT